MDGSVEVKKISKNYKKPLDLDKIVFFIFLLIAILTPLIGTYFIFKSCINIKKITLANTISLGAILATFGAAIISSIVLIQTDKSNRILLNVDILFLQILKKDKWTRWPFIKRSSIKKLLDDSFTLCEVTNPTIPFNVGTHIIDISIPTVKEDFFDFPILFNSGKMVKFNKQFKTFVVNGRSTFNEPGFSDIDDYGLCWDCLYDIWRNVLLFKINKVLIKFGTSILV